MTVAQKRLLWIDILLAALLVLLLGFGALG